MLNFKICRILLIFLSVLFFSCSNSDNTNQNLISSVDDTGVVSGGWLIYHIGAEPATLNPITASDAVESTINGNNIYESLAKRDYESLEIVPQLAESWEISDDKLKYRFKLRENVKWHDGVPFTSEDVVFSYNTIMDPKVDTPHLRSYYQEILSVKALSKFEVEFTYARPYFLALEFCSGMPIVPKHLFDEGDFNKNPYGRKPVGTGPYKFVKWETSSEIVIKKNEDYWGEKPEIQRIIFKIINDPTVTFQVLKRGDLDVSGLTPIQWDRQSNTKVFKDNFNKYKYFRPNYSFIGWNQNRPYFSDKNVRIAMTHLLNRELILNKILLDLGVVVTNPFYLNSPEYNKSIQPYEFNPEKAKLLLEKADWIDHNGDGIRDKNGVKFEFEFLLPSGSETGEKIATILKEELDKAGIVMNIRKTEWAVFTTRLNERKFDAVTLAWSMGVESDPYQIWSSTQMETGHNFVGFENKRADEIIIKARKEFDRQIRINYYREFAEIVHEEQPYTFLFCRMSTVAVGNRFRDVVVYPLGLNPLAWYVPKNLQKYGLN
jgi:peptide/nickel transport system substrate-binding protein